MIRKISVALVLLLVFSVIGAGAASARYRSGSSYDNVKVVASGTLNNGNWISMTVTPGYQGVTTMFYLDLSSGKIVVARFNQVQRSPAGGSIILPGNGYVNGRHVEEVNLYLQSNGYFALNINDEGSSLYSQSGNLTHRWVFSGVN